MKAKVNGVEIAYEDAGSGIPVVLIHGFPLDRTMWSEQSSALASTATRFIVPDLRGFGDSEAPSAVATMEAYADDVRGLLDHLRVRRAVIAGLSMGGYVALAFARLFPERVRALILCDTRAAADSAEARAGRYEMAQLARDRGAAAVADKMMPKMLSPETAERRPDVAGRVRAMMERIPVNGIVSALQAIAQRHDSTPLLPKIKCPVLFLVGESDAITPPDEAAIVSARLSNVRLVVVASAGHMSPMENPQSVNAAIAAFLREIPPED